MEKKRARTEKLAIYQRLIMNKNKIVWCIDLATNVKKGSGFSKLRSKLNWSRQPARSVWTTMDQFLKKSNLMEKNQCRLMRGESARHFCFRKPREDIKSGSSMQVTKIGKKNIHKKWLSMSNQPTIELSTITQEPSEVKIQTIHKWLRHQSPQTMNWFVSLGRSQGRRTSDF